MTVITDEESATVIARARVARVWRPCPTFARIVFRGADLVPFGTPGHTFDQRIKVLFPPSSGALPGLREGSEWYADWLALPEEERGSIRTYSIRDLRTEAGQAEVTIDFVLHEAPVTSPLKEARGGAAGGLGPAAAWASQAAAGDEVLLVGPRRDRFDGGGIEFAPGDAARVLLAGDETAAPAIARILEDAGPDLQGDAFIELAGARGALSIDAPSGVRVHWLERTTTVPGELLVPRVLHSLGRTGGESAYRAKGGWENGGVVAARNASDQLVWETPEFSALGEPLGAGASGGSGDHGATAGSHLSDRYFWIAGESSVVTRLRRHLVRDLGVHRSRVAFMGYWREGVAMR